MAFPQNVVPYVMQDVRVRRRYAVVELFEHSVGPVDPTLSIAYF